MTGRTTEDNASSLEEAPLPPIDLQAHLVLDNFRGHHGFRKTKAVADSEALP